MTDDEQTGDILSMSHESDICCHCCKHSCCLHIVSPTSLFLSREWELKLATVMESDHTSGSEECSAVNLC